MNVSEKIRVALIRCSSLSENGSGKITVKSLADKLGISAQALHNRLSRPDRWTVTDLQQVADALGIEMEITFTLPNGEKI